MSSLSHHGVKGQKWGVRRYQNKDGTRTALGKRRDFERTASKVVEDASNSPKPFVRRPFNKDKIRQRGLITQAEADQCAGLAAGVFKQASQAEPKITSDVIDVVSSTSAKMYGLNNRLKQPTSIAAKIGADAKADGITFEQAAGGLKDAIRYTAVSDSRDYVDSYNAIKQRLEEKGYTEVKCKNYFQKYQNGEVMHKAVQSTFRSPDGVEFEFQFQTPESQAAKELKVPIYNERRKAGNTPERNAELELEMRNLAEQVPDPEGVFGIESHSGVTNMKHSSLSHHGVKGQKHGVRQYQNEDGTLTPLGREHYGYGDSESGGGGGGSSDQDEIGEIDKILESMRNPNGEHTSYDSDRLDHLAESALNAAKRAQNQNEAELLRKKAKALQEMSKKVRKFNPIEHSSMTGDGMLVVDGTLYLEHHGVKGQKHGVRQYQNYDGSLTSLGRIHYGYGQARSKAEPIVSNALKKTGQAAGIVTNAFKEARQAAAAASEERRERKQAKLKEKASKDRSSVLRNRNLFTTKELEDLEKRFTAEDKLRANVPDKKALRKAASDQKAAEKLAERKEKASQTREGVLKNKKLFTNEELKALSERFNTEDKIKQESIDKGLAAVKNLANAAQSIQTIVGVFEDVSGVNISPIKRAQAEQKKAWDLEDRQRKQKFEDTKEAREEGKYKREEASAAAKDKRDIETWERDKQRADAKDQREIEQVEYNRKRDRAKDQRERAERLIKKRQDAEDRKRKLAREDAEDRRKAAEEIRKIKKEAAEERRKATTGKNLARKQKAEARLAEIKAIEAAMGLSNNEDLTDFEEWLKTIDPTWTRHDSFDSDYIIQNGVLLVNPQGSSLAHHGIKGQKWGVRRYQNYDGSLTKAGRERYGTGPEARYNASINEDAIRASGHKYYANKHPKNKIGYNDNPKDAENAADKRRSEIAKELRKMGFKISENMTAEEHEAATAKILEKPYTEKRPLTAEDFRQIPDRFRVEAITDKEKQEDRKKTIESELNKAVNEDSWQLDFLETIQNDWYLDNDHPGAAQARLAEYKKYLDDPENYHHNHHADEYPPSVTTKRNTWDAASKVSSIPETETKMEYSKEEQKQRLARAKKDNLYDNDFMEATVYWGDDKGSKENLDAEYEKYLANPQKYLHSQITPSEYWDRLDRSGQSWGVRRYQNLDGSLTEAGKKKYEKAQEKKRKTVETRVRALQTAGNYSAVEIAKMLGVSESTVRSVMADEGLKTKKQNSRYGLNIPSDYRQQPGYKKKAKHSSLESNYIIQNGVLMINPAERR